MGAVDSLDTYTTYGEHLNNGNGEWEGIVIITLGIISAGYFIFKIIPDYYRDKKKAKNNS